MTAPSNRLLIKPPSREAWLALRPMDVTSTESAALFGQSPYATQFELWHRKKEGAVVEIDGNERMDWGTDLQDAIALALARRHGVTVAPIHEYMRILDSRMGASFDYEITGADGGKTPEGSVLSTLFMKHGPGIFEIKNVDSLVFRDQWVVNEDKSIDPPGHIDVQLQHQLHVREREWGAIGVLVGGNRHKIIVRMRDREVGAALESRIRAFWQSIEADTPPPPVFPGDAAFVCKLYNYADPGKVFDGRGNAELEALALEYRAALDREKLAKEEKEVAKAKMLTIIGDAERAYGDTFTVSAGLIGPCLVEAYERKGYRNWKLTPKKGAKP
jgi:predicted phage-related endonuclease